MSATAAWAVDGCTVTSNGSVQTATCTPVGNPYASGIHYGGADVTAPFTLTAQSGVVVNGAYLSAGGADEYGISVGDTNDDLIYPVTIANAGTIDLSGVTPPDGGSTIAIQGFVLNGPLTISNTGALTADFGIRASANGGVTTVTSSGVLATGAVGIEVDSFSDAPDSVVIKNSGAIDSAGAGISGSVISLGGGLAGINVGNSATITALDGDGIEAQAFGQTAASTVGNSATINSSGASIYAYASAPDSGTASVAVTNSGNLNTALSPAIDAESVATHASTGVINSGHIFANAGIFAESTSFDAGTALTAVINSQTITALGRNGIDAEATGQASATVTVGNTAAGSIGATGAYGIYTAAQAGNNDALSTSKASITVTNAAQVVSVYDSIYASANGNALASVIVNNAGTLYAVGNGGGPGVNSYGIEASASAINGFGGIAGVSVTNSGQINAFNQDGIEAIAEADALARTSITNSGVIQAADYGIYTEADGTYGDAGSSAAVVTNSAAVTAANYAIYAESYADANTAITISNTAGGTLMASNGYGIHAEADSSEDGSSSSSIATVTVGNAGSITSNDDAIYAYALSSGSATATVTNTGHLTTTGDGYGIDASAGNYDDYATTARTIVTNAGQIDSASDGIDSYAYGFASAASQVRNSATINAGDYGIDAESFSDTGNSGVATTVVVNSGAITATNDEAIDAEAYGDAHASVRVFNTGVLNAGEDGIYAYASTDGDASAIAQVSVDNRASITSNDDRGIYAEAYGNGGAYITILNSGAIQSDGDGLHAGAHGEQDGAPAVVGVVNTARINAGEDGIDTDARAQGAALAQIQITNSGVITASDSGIEATTRSRDDGGTGLIVITNSGAITSGDWSIYGRTDADVAARVTVTNSAQLVSEGSDGIHTYAGADNDGGVASTFVSNTGGIRSDEDGIDIKANASATAVASLVNSATIVAVDSGLEATAEAYGPAGSGTIAIRNTGNLTSNDDGVRAYAYGEGTGAATVNVFNSGTIRSQDEGIYALAERDDDGVSNAVATIVNRGAVSSEYALDAEAYGDVNATAQVLNAGAVTGLREGIYTEADADTAAVLVRNSGRIDANNAAGDGYGIDAEIYSNTGSLVVANTGRIVATGSNSAYGVYAYAGTFGDGATTASVLVNNVGAITATGPAGATEGAGVYLHGLGDVTLDNSGTITATNVQAAVVFADETNDPALLVNTNSIVNTNGVAVLSGDQPTTVQNYGFIATQVPGGTAIQLGAGNNELLIGTGSRINGFVTNGSTNGATFTVYGRNTLAFGGSGTDTFNLDAVALSPGQLGYAPAAGGTFDTDAPAVDVTHQYQGFANFVKTGASTWRLVGTLGNDGPVAVQQGTLIVDGSIANSPTTVTNATLGGSGTVGPLTVGAGGIVAPGALTPFTTLTVAGNATFGAGSTLRVNVGAGNDLLAVTGTADVSGATLLVNQIGGLQRGATYRVLTAGGGVTGPFADVETTSPFLVASASYDPNDAFLSVDSDFAAFGRSRNQSAVAGQLDQLALDSPLLAALFPLSTAQIGGALDSLSGEIHASAATAAVEDTRIVREAAITRLLDADREDGPGAGQAVASFGLLPALPAGAQGYAPVHKGYDMPAAYPAPLLPRFALWGQGFGDFGSNRGNGNAATLDRRMGGFVIGGDTRVDGSYFNNWRVGLLGGYTSDDISVSRRGSTGTYESAFGGIYAGAHYGAVALRLGAVGGATWTETQRSIAFPGFFESARSNANGSIVQGFGELGYKIGLRQGFIEPVVGGAAIHVEQDRFRESAGAAALQGFGRDTDVETVTAGLRAESAPFASLPIIARGFLGYRHAFGDVTPTAVVAFQAGGGAFQVEGAPIDRDALVTEIGIDYRTSSAWTVGIAYSGQYGERADSSAVKGKVEYKF